jgi:hypothetical protein
MELSSLSFSSEETAKRRNSLSDVANMKDTGIKQNRSPEEVIASLNEGYFTAEFDPVEMHLEKVQTWSESEMAENFMMAIEETDVNKDVVVSKLSAMIESSYGDLMGCMRDVHAIDIDLARTGIQVTNSRRKLNSADKLIVSGTLKIQDLHVLKERLQEVETISGAVLKLKHMYLDVQRLMNSGELGRSALCAYDLLLALQNEVFEKIFCVAHLGDSVQNLIPVIRFKTDHALFKLCSRGFTPEKYADIVSSYLMLDVMQETMGVQIIDPKMASNGDTFLSDSGPSTDGLADRIIRFMTVDVENSIREAILEFLPEPKKVQWQQFAGRMDDSNSPLQTMINDVPEDFSVLCVVRSCEHVASVMHTHYLITQWHRLPFDERNRDIAFLHRCPNEMVSNGLSDDEEDSGEEESESDGEETALKSTAHAAADEHLKKKKKTKTQTAASLAVDTQQSGDSTGVALTEDVGERLRKARLALASQNLARSRALLWERIEAAINLVLNAVHPSSAVSVEDFLCMTWCLKSLMRMGHEFCGLQSTRILSTLRQKCIEYFSEIHNDSFDHLRSMIESETWSSVPVRLNDMGGIIGIIKSNVRKRDAVKGASKPRIRLQGMIRETEELRRKKTAALAAKYVGETPTAKRNDDSNDGPPPEIEVTQLMSFQKYGNPLHLTVCIDEQNLDETEDYSPTAAGGSAQPTTGPAYFSPIGSEFLSLLLEEDVVPKGRRAQERSAAVVVTQSALNGLARHTGKYLLMMHLMSAASVDIFLGLKELFEYYLCAVFNGFVPQEDRRNVLLPPARSSAFSPPPMQAKDFEVCKFYV